MSFKDHPEWIYKGGRGKSKYWYTVDDIASVRGVSVQTVRNYFSKRGFKFDKLRDVYRYLSS